MKSKKELKLMLVSFLEELLEKFLAGGEKHEYYNAAILTAINRKVKDTLELIDKLK